jgi:hypothetical protein
LRDYRNDFAGDIAGMARFLDLKAVHDLLNGPKLGWMILCAPAFSFQAGQLTSAVLLLLPIPLAVRTAQASRRIAEQRVHRPG